MATVSDIPKGELAHELDNPQALEASSHFVLSRVERLQGIYKLLAMVKGKRTRERNEVIKEFSLYHGGGAVEGLLADLKWARIVDLPEMLSTFTLNRVDSDWPKRLTQSHFRLVGSAKRQDSNLTSTEAITWLVKAYHSDWFSGSLAEALVAEGYEVPANLSPKKAKGTPATALDLLDVMLRQLRKSGTDFLIDGLKEGSFRVAPTMRKLAEGWLEHHPTATFIIANDETPKDTPTA